MVILCPASLGLALGPVQHRPANVLDWGHLAQKPGFLARWGGSVIWGQVTLSWVSTCLASVSFSLVFLSTQASWGARDVTPLIGPCHFSRGRDLVLVT